MLARGPGQLSLSSITCPVLFVHGTADPIVRPRIAEAAHRLVPGSEPEWVEGGGRFIIGADPGVLLDVVPNDGDRKPTAADGRTSGDQPG